MDLRLPDGTSATSAAFYLPQKNYVRPLEVPGSLLAFRDRRNFDSRSLPGPGDLNELSSERDVHALLQMCLTLGAVALILYRVAPSSIAYPGCSDNTEDDSHPDQNLEAI